MNNEENKQENIEENDDRDLEIGEAPEIGDELSEALKRAENERKRADELTDLCQRLQADFDNYRKRNNEMAKRIREEAASEVIIKFLPIMDVIDQALAMIKDESVLNGIDMVRKQLTAIFEDNGVKEIEALNKDFDPNFHNAVMSVDDETNSGKVVEVFQKGYIRGDKVIRHSAVKIAK